MAERTSSSKLAQLYGSFGVLISGFLVTFLQNGSFKAFGVLYEDVLKEYKTSNLFIGGIFSFELAACYVIAGISGAVPLRTSNRTMGIIGGFLFGLGFVLQGALGERLWHFFLYMGVTAVGVGILYFAVFLAYVEHFGDLFYLAYSFRDTFFYVGVTAMPPALEYVRGQYGLHAAFLILGAITWNGVVAGVLLKPSHNTKVTSQNEKEESEDSEQFPTDNCCNKSKMDRFDGSYSHTSFVGISALTNHPLFSVSVLLHSLTNFNFVVWALFLVPYGTSLGYPPEVAVYLSTLGGIGGFAGKIVVIIVFYYGKMNQILSNAVPGVIFGTALVGYIVCKNYLLLLLFSFWSGVSLAFADASTCAMVTRYICNQHLRHGIVMFYLCGGAFIQLGGTVAGALLDVTSSFPTVFCAMFVINIVIILLAVLMQKMDDVETVRGVKQ